MALSSKFLQGTYLVSIALYLPFIMQQICSMLQVSNLVGFFVLVFCGLSCICLGIFKFSHGLGVGLLLAGLRCTALGSWPYWYKINESFRFLAAFCVLLILLYAWYRVSRQVEGK